MPVAGIDTPTLCYLENLTPVNVCRICVVELARVAHAGPGLLSTRRAGDGHHGPIRRASGCRARWCSNSSARPWTSRPLPRPRHTRSATAPAPSATVPPRAASGPAERDGREAGHHHLCDGTDAETVAQPVKVDNDLYVRDYGKCILCYKCVEACGTDAQNTFAIAVAGRGFDARISTEGNVPLPDSACVYCGNCIGVCPTGALMFRSEYEMRRRNEWDESRQTQHRHDLPLLRRRLHALAPRPGQPNRQGHVAAGRRGHARPPVHQGAVRLRVRARRRSGGRGEPRFGFDSFESRHCLWRPKLRPAQPGLRRESDHLSDRRERNHCVCARQMSGVAVVS